MIAIRVPAYLREDDPRMTRLAAEVDGVGTFYVDSDLSRGLVVDLARALKVGPPALVERVAADARAHPWITGAAGAGVS